MEGERKVPSANISPDHFTIGSVYPRGRNNQESARQYTITLERRLGGHEKEEKGGEEWITVGLLPLFADFSVVSEVTCVPAGSESASSDCCYQALSLPRSLKLPFSPYLPPTHTPLGAAKPTILVYS